MEYICGEKAEGKCICDELFVFNDAGECVLDPNEVVTAAPTTIPVPTTPETIISTCNGNGGLFGGIYELGCKQTDTGRACWKGNTYKYVHSYCEVAMQLRLLC